MKRITFLLLGVMFLTLAACGAATTTGVQEEPAPPLAEDVPLKPAEGNPLVLMDTSMGKIKIELYVKKAPITVKNFLEYVDKKHYDGTVFHRVIADFMIQGGGFKEQVTDARTPAQFEAAEKATANPIKNEASNGVSNERRTIAMARTSNPDSATAQFFINVKDNSGSLDPSPRIGAGYAVFGRVIEGMNVVDAIRGVKTKSLPFGVNDVPVKPVIIKSVRRVEAEKQPNEKPDDKEE